MEFGIDEDTGHPTEDYMILKAHLYGEIVGLFDDTFAELKVEDESIKKELVHDVISEIMNRLADYPYWDIDKEYIEEIT